MLANIKVIGNSLSQGVPRPQHEANQVAAINQSIHDKIRFVERLQDLKG